jgi:hypothetical protein
MKIVTVDVTDLLKIFAFNSFRKKQKYKLTFFKSNSDSIVYLDFSSPIQSCSIINFGLARARKKNTL